MPQKRPRQDPEATVANGSDQGGAPGIDEAARRADSIQHAPGIPSSRNPVAAPQNVTARFSIGTPATTAQGVKRGADGNDDERLDMDRAEDDAPTPAPTPPVTPARLTPGVSSSSNWQGAESAMIKSTIPHGSGQAQAWMQGGCWRDIQSSARLRHGR